LYRKIAVISSFDRYNIGKHARSIAEKESKHDLHPAAAGRIRKSDPGALRRTQQRL
jgi:hypothetical protein